MGKRRRRTIQISEDKDDKSKITIKFPIFLVISSSNLEITLGTDRRPYLDAIVASKMEQGVLEHASMAGGEHKPVAVEPVGVLGVLLHDLVVHDVAHGRAPNGEARVA